jgi:hypothetical protein
MLLAVPTWIDPEGAFSPYLSALNWNQINVMCFEAVDAEVVNFAQVVSLEDLWVGMVRVGAAGPEPHRSRLESSGLALHSCEPVALVNDKVIPQVLAERNEDRASEHD